MERNGQLIALRIDKACVSKTYFLYATFKCYGIVLNAKWPVKLFIILENSFRFFAQKTSAYEEKEDEATNKQTWKPNQLNIAFALTKGYRSKLESLYGATILLINQTFISTPHRRSTTVSLETNSLIYKLNNQLA